MNEIEFKLALHEKLCDMTVLISDIVSYRVY